MEIKIKGFITSKKSEMYSDCADNYAINTENNKFAISDGVSKSFFPKVWSEILVNKYVFQKDWRDDEFIMNCQKEWQNKIDEIANKPEIKWHTRTLYNRREPALATFVGLEFIESEQKWIAQALGDSFLFFIPNGSNQISIQLSSKSEPIVFDNFPDYLSSISIHPNKGKARIKEKSIVEGTFYLMTDALAEWFIFNTEFAIQALNNIQSQEQFLEMVYSERIVGRLNDDDSAVLIIDLIDDNKKEFTYFNSEITYLSELIKKEVEEVEEIKKKGIFFQNSLTEERTSNAISDNKSLEIESNEPQFLTEEKVIAEEKTSNAISDNKSLETESNEPKSLTEEKVIAEEKTSNAISDNKSLEIESNEPQFLTEEKVIAEEKTSNAISKNKSLKIESNEPKSLKEDNLQREEVQSRPYIEGGKTENVLESDTEKFQEKKLNKDEEIIQGIYNKF